MNKRFKIEPCCILFCDREKKQLNSLSKVIKCKYNEKLKQNIFFRGYLIQFYCQHCLFLFFFAVFVIKRLSDNNKKYNRMNALIFSEQMIQSQTHQVTEK